MNKRILLLFTIISLFCSAAHSMTKGDITNNGLVDVDDLNAVLNIILKKKIASDFPGNADIDSSGIVDIDDVNILINIILRKDIEKETFTVYDVSFNMVKVTGGTFMMGGTEEQGENVHDDELPVHQVTLSDYYIAETEVTQALWQAVTGSNPSYFKGDLNRPVESVTWYDCQVFINTLNHMTGYKFRLLTEAEWEYAARGGNKSKGYKYSGSNNLDAVAWYGDNSNSSTHPVASKKPNELSIYDMTGNVFEWCHDSYTNYPSEPQINPTGPVEGDSSVSRGGSYYKEFCRISYRSPKAKNSKNQVRGLRLAMTDCTKGEPTTGSVLSISEITLISAVANCSFVGIDEDVNECGIIVKGNNKTLTFPANIVNGEQVVDLAGLRPWTTYQCYAYVKSGNYTYQQKEPVTFSTPDLAGTWNCSETNFGDNQSETSTIVFTASGGATFTHTGGDTQFMPHSPNTGSWSVDSSGEIRISFSDAKDGTRPWYYQKVFTGNFDSLVHPTKANGTAKRNSGSTSDHITYGNFSMTRQQ